MFTKTANATPSIKYNKEQGCTNFQQRAITQNAPRLFGEILSEILSSKSPLATGYRQFLAQKQMQAEKGGAL